MTKLQFTILLGLIGMAGVEFHLVGLTTAAIVCQALYFFQDEV